MCCTGWSRYACYLLIVIPGLCLGGNLDETPILVRQTEPAGTLHRLVLGNGYRQVWATAISIPILDLEHTAGGLEPIRRVGQLQTAGLAFKGRDGRSYTFRSIDKDPTRALPPEFVGTLVADVVRDQVSADLPAASIIAAAITRAAGVQAAQPELVVMPDDPSLLQYRAQFAGMPGTFEQYPTSASLGAQEIIDGAEMITRMQSDPRQRVDSLAYLKARLVDLLLGDWDRHIGQWRWIRFDQRPLWQPLPEDRDHAFSRYDGLLMNMLRDSEPRFLEYGAQYQALEGSTWRARQLDRRFLVALERSDWQRTAEQLQAAITDDVIQQAVARWPQAWRKLSGQFLIDSLMARRDGLLIQAMRYYEYISGQVDIYGSDVAQRFSVDVIDRRTVEVAVQTLVTDVDAKSTVSQPIAVDEVRRRFHHDETDAIRIYPASNNDQLSITAEEGSGIKVHIVAPAEGMLICSEQCANTNRLAAQSLDARGPGKQIVGGVWLAPPSSDAEQRLLAHGEDGSASTARRDWGHTSYGIPWFAYGPDLGIFVGYGRAWESFGFRRRPYGHRQQLRAGYAFGRDRPKIDYRWDYHFENRPLQLQTLVEVSGIDTLNFYGFGNETRVFTNDDFFDVRSTSAGAATRLAWSLGKNSVSAGLGLHYTATDQQGFIAQARPYGVDDIAQAGVQVAYAWNSRVSDGGVGRKPSDDAWRFSPSMEQPGYALNIEGTHYPEILDLIDAYSLLRLGARADYRLFGSQHRISLRVGGQRNWGEYPYYDAAVIGSQQVRGLSAGRYAGDASIYANTSLRFKAGDLQLLVPGEWGFQLRGDVGRVFLSAEDSSVWHPSAGIGLWWRPLAGPVSANLYVAKSNEDTRVYFMLGARL